jgi:excisionase family DNA binding protein
MEAYLTINEVAAVCKLSVQTIRRYVLKREIPFHKIHRAVRFKPSEIAWWVENKEALRAVYHSENSDNGLFEEVPLEEADRCGGFVESAKTFEGGVGV